MKKELLKQQIKPLLLFGLPAWGFTIVFVYVIKKPLLTIIIFCAYLFPAAINSKKFWDLYNMKFSPKWGFKLAPHYVEAEDELNKLYFIDMRWKIVFFGIVLILFVTTSPFFHS